MASSNRHWPSMFKSKPINHHSCSRSSDNSSFSSGCEERSTPEPKPRWNPKPEQIRILEAIFNSGMVNPPRDEIRRIRTQLQEYGQVGDANVFYWFQNRKSRSKNKQRNLQPKTATTNTVSTVSTTTATSSSSSSSDKNSPNNKSTKNNINNIIGSGGGGGGEHFVNSPTSVNQCSSNYFQQLITPNNHLQFHEFVSHEPVYFPLHQNGASVLGNNNNNNNNTNTNNNNFNPNLCFAHNNNNNNMNGGDHVQLTLPCDETVGGFSSLLFGEIFNGGGGGGGGLKGDDEVEKLKFQQELSFLVSTQDNNNNTNNNNNNNGCTTLPSSSHVVSTPISTAITTDLGHFVGEAGGMPGKMMVFINGMAIEVPSGSFNVKEEFGDDVMLVHASTGQPVVTNEWGVTLHGLQQGASYYLVGAHLVASPLLHKLDNAPDILASDFPYQI